MQTGDARRAGSQRGFTYLILLFALAIGGIGLAALGEQARQRALREQEAELAFRGAEIAAAIASYVAASPGARHALPQRIEDLLEDRRSGRVVRHLRKFRPDPLGGQWVLLRPGEAGCAGEPGSITPVMRSLAGFTGVRTDSRRPLLRRDGDAPKLACEWVFHHQAFRPPTAPARDIPVSP
ncbi:MAG: type II secretion system protein [Burkholderiales bacterium]|nr:MAG: type II secretion system protein [Burkholderiales bacterium]